MLRRLLQAKKHYYKIELSIEQIAKRWKNPPLSRKGGIILVNIQILD